MTKAALVGTIIFSCPIWSVAQPNWTEIIAPIYTTLNQRIQDSIAARRSESDQIRTKMRALVQEEALSPSMIFGQDDKWILEGMHREFTSPPAPLQVQMERNKKIVALENLHVELYYSDKTLFAWKDLSSQSLTHQQKFTNSKLDVPWKRLYPQAQPSSPKAIQEWAADAILCDLIHADHRVNRSADKERLKGFNMGTSTTLEKALGDKVYTWGANWKLPFSPDSALVTYPTNGEFAWCKSIPNVGYMIFPTATAPILNEAVSYGEIWAKWTEPNGRTLFTLAELRYPANLFFNYPDLLQRGVVYHLELMVLPKNFNAVDEAGEPQNCWNDVGGGYSGHEKWKKEKRLVQGKLLSELYFRTERNDIVHDFGKIKGRIDLEKGAYIFDTTEPFGPHELYGKHLTPPSLEFNFSSSFAFSNHINAKAIYYYLLVPEVEQLDTLPISKLAKIEQDHTYETPFIGDVKLGNYDYLNLPGSETLEDKPYKISKDYFVPVCRRLLDDSLITSRPVPFIGKQHFTVKPPKEWATPVRCTLIIKELQEYVTAVIALQTQIQKRMEERAVFFYQIEKRKAERAGLPLTVTLQDMRDREMRNMPSEAKKMLAPDWKTTLLASLSIHYSKHFPGSQLYMTQVSNKFQ